MLEALVLAVLVAAVVFGASRLVPEEQSRAARLCSELPSELRAETHGRDRVVLFVGDVPVRLEWRRGELTVQARWTVGVGPELSVELDANTGTAKRASTRRPQWAARSLAGMRAVDVTALGNDVAVRARGGLIATSLHEHAAPARVVAAARVLAAIAATDEGAFDAVRALPGARFEGSDGPWHGASRPRVVIERGGVIVAVEAVAAADGVSLSVSTEPPRERRRFRTVIGAGSGDVELFDEAKRALTARLGGAELLHEPKRVQLLLGDTSDEAVASAVDLVASFGSRGRAA